MTKYQLYQAAYEIYIREGDWVRAALFKSALNCLTVGEAEEWLSF